MATHGVKRKFSGSPGPYDQQEVRGLVSADSIEPDAQEINSEVNVSVAEESESESTSEGEYMSSENDFTEEDDANEKIRAHFAEDFRPLEQRHEHLGINVTREFMAMAESEDDDRKDIFDDGLEDDENSSSDSDVSTRHEEPEESQVEPPVATIQVSSDSEIDCDDESEESLSNGWNSSSDDDVASDAEQRSSSADSKHPGLSEAGHEDIPTVFERFSEILESKYESLYQKSQYAGAPIKLLADDTEIARFNIRELQEAKKRIEQQLIDMEAQLEVAEERQHSAESKFLSNLEASGISLELYRAYENFCHSLNPDFGQRGGFSITCNEPHEGSYIKYDPDLALFKERVEMRYDNCNFRCEAQTVSVKAEEESIVEFWPVKPPEPSEDTEVTWREQYPELYKLAWDAVRAGSKAAMDLLICLPDTNYSFKGWLFQYVFEEKMKNETQISRRWRFASAHNIDSPVTNAAKRERLEFLLRPENDRYI